jgi:glycosyltransferase involved in cell wall biosynthesis
MPRENLLRTYDAHGIYLFPSFFEGFAQTFLEAMARGLAVLATRVDGMAQAIRNGENGYLFERGRSAEMADVAISLIDEQVDLDQLGREARRTAADYTWDRSAGMFENFVTSLRRPTSQIPP